MTIESGRVDAPAEGKRGEPAALDIRNLSLVASRGANHFSVLDDVSLHVSQGEAVGIIGESGSGKSLLVRSIAGLLPDGINHSAGEVWVGDTRIDGASKRALRSVRGKDVGMVFQDSIGSLDPLFTIGSQMVEAMRVHRKVSKRDARSKAIELLAEVGINDPESRMSAYPHELSGGMAQRAAIAISVVNSPKLLVADEATTALDVTIQKQVIALFKRIQQEYQCAVVFVSHDLATVASLVDRVVVMYAGSVVEVGPTQDVLGNPRHPYTAALLRSRPKLGGSPSPVKALPGGVPAPGQWPSGCRFHPRCPIARAEPCSSVSPVLSEQEHAASCHFPLGEENDDGSAKDND